MPMRVTGKQDNYFSHCCSCPIDRKSVLLGFSFNLLWNIHFKTESRQDFKLSSWFAESFEVNGIES